MDSYPVCKHSSLWRRGATAHGYPASNCVIEYSMPDHDGLFAHQLPIGISCFTHPILPVLCRDQFDIVRPLAKV